MTKLATGGYSIVWKNRSRRKTYKQSGGKTGLKEPSRMYKMFCSSCLSDNYYHLAKILVTSCLPCPCAFPPLLLWQWVAPFQHHLRMLFLCLYWQQREPCQSEYILTLFVFSTLWWNWPWVTNRLPIMARKALQENIYMWRYKPQPKQHGVCWPPYNT